MNSLPRIEWVNASPKAEVLALAWFKGEDKAPMEYLGSRTEAVIELEKRLGRSRHFSGKNKEADLLRFYGCEGAENVLLLGMGSKKNLDSEQYRQAGGALFTQQKRGRFSKLALRADGLLLEEDGELERLEALVEGYYLAAYDYKELKKVDPDDFFPGGFEIVGPKNSIAKKAIERGAHVASAVNLARYLGDRPSNLLTPSEFASFAQKELKGSGVHVTVLGRREIEKEKMGLFLGVAIGSEEEPKFLILEYRGGKKSDRPVALVGKGITFDSGGISIKPAAKMEEMKYDMMGAATVLGVMHLIAALKLPINVTGYIAATENMPSGKAQRPGDIRKSMSGKTVEIINTDAEGRLVLADALEYAQRAKPQAIVDFATLTGAVVVALGTVASGIMGNNRELLKRIKDAAKDTGEKVWELPLFQEYEEDLKSHFADIKNSGIRDAGSSKGGIFLKFFVDDKVPWAHCDIAGTAWARKDLNYLSSKFASGVLVRTMTRMLEKWKPL